VAACSLLLGCGGARVPVTVPFDNGPALVLDGMVLSCQGRTPAPADTGCPALALVTVRAASFLPGSDAVHLFGPAAEHGAYVAQTPTLDMTPAPQKGGVVPLALIVDGVRFACLTRLPADPRRLDRPGIPCPPLERLSPDDVDRVEALKPPRAIELFGRDGAAGAIIVILKRHR
jgi:hypothetical protein